MGILILFSSFSKLKTSVVFSISPFGAFVSRFFVFLYCVALVSTILVWEVGVSSCGLVSTISFS
jgi:hypothetical protein